MQTLKPTRPYDLYPIACLQWLGGLRPREAAYGQQQDVDFVKDGPIDAKLAKLAPYQIGKHGQLQEWLEDFEESDPGHRHQSHLFPLFPGHSITPRETPELFTAQQVVGCWLNPKPDDSLPTQAEDFAGAVSFEAWILPQEKEAGRVLDKLTAGKNDGFLGFLSDHFSRRRCLTSPPGCFYSARP